MHVYMHVYMYDVCRFLFILPWQGKVLIGTTDRRVDAARGPVPREEDIQWLLKESGKFFKSEFKLSREDVRSAWSGIRPLAIDPSHAHAGKDGGGGDVVSRDHIVHYDERSGTVLVAGGKWTTYRHMAQDAVDAVLRSPSFKYPLYRECSTLSTHLVGYEGYSNDLPARLVKEFDISERLAAHLAGSYGGRSRDVLKVARSMKNGDGDGDGFRRLVDGIDTDLYQHIGK